MIEGIEVSFYGAVYSEGCPGCNRIEPQPRGLQIVFENSAFRVHQDFKIPIPLFLVIESKRHIASVEEFTDDEFYLFGMAWSDVRAAMRLVSPIEAVTAFQQDKSSHFHHCLLPQYPWMNDLIPNYHQRDIQNTMDWAEVNLKNSYNIMQLTEAAAKVKGILTSPK